MRRTLLASAGALLLAALVVTAAPALTAQRYQPRAVDFELAAPALSAARTGPVATPSLRPSRRFNLVGLRWASGGEPRVSLRFRRDGRGWSRWTRVGAGQDHGPDPGTGERTPAGASDPVWVGEADEVQVRLSRRVSGLRLHFVNVAGTASAADRARTALRRVANGAVRTVAGVLRPAAAGAQDAQPEIVPRSAWEAGQCTPRTDPAYREVKMAFVHHTVTATDYAPEDVPGMILGMCRYHRDSNGWNDLGYNFVVDRFGRIWEGRGGGIDKPVVGAHTTGMNTQSFGVANLGTYTDVPVTEEAMGAMTRLIRWKLPLHGQPTSGQATVVSNGGSGSRFAAGEQATLDRVSGHRDANSTGCPGDALYAQLPALRERVAGAQAAPRPKPTIAVERPPRRVPKKSIVRIRGSVQPPKQSLSVLVEKKKGDRWVRSYGRTVPPGADGSFRKKVRLRDVGLYRISAVFGGDGSNAPARSKRYPVRVPRKASSSPSGPSYSDPR
ncbi:MAG TPA: N-acetylmuramoyl-L-alanine amidase [Thermoleophilaceae bacterium]